MPRDSGLVPLAGGHRVDQLQKFGPLGLVQVQQADTGAFAGQFDGDIDRNGAFADAAFAGQHEDFLTDAGHNAIEFFHGYTYSAHPAACAAGIATQKIYEEEGLFDRAADMSAYFIDAVWSLKGHPLVADLRAYGMMAGVELHHDGVPGRRGTQMQKDMFWNGLHVKFTGDNGILAPAFVAERSHIDEIIDKFLKTLDQHK